MVGDEGVGVMDGREGEGLNGEEWEGGEEGDGVTREGVEGKCGGEEGEGWGWRGGDRERDR